MKITVLIENMVYRKGLAAEHGLALHIDTGSAVILFDTGQTEAFVQNAMQLGIDLSEVDYLVISHGHFDHTGGINKFLEINSKAKVLMHARALNPKFGKDKYIGIPRFITIPPERIHYINDLYTISNNVSLMGDIKIKNADDTHMTDFFVEHNSELVPDAFKDELFLGLETENGIHLISGCSHRGISNILLTAKGHFSKPIISLIGGFHLVNSTYEQLQNLITLFNSESVENIYTGHCTGLENYCTLKEFSNAIVNYMHTAFVIEL